MFDKSNKNYKLYLAGVISESQYMDLCELVNLPGPMKGTVGPQGHMDPTKASDEELDMASIGQAQSSYVNFLKHLTDIKSKQKALSLLSSFIREFLRNTHLTDPIVKKTILDALKGQDSQALQQ